MQQTFRKRTGTTDKGKGYEILNIADIVINLVTDAKIDEFHISADDDDFGAFDDIVVQTQVENSTEIYAMQLKHSERGNLSLNQLTQARGDFSLNKYFASVQTMEVATAKLILFTNLKFNVPEGTIFYLCNEDFPVTLTKLYPNNSFKISQKTDYCYKFSIVGDYEHCPKARPWKTFFEHFYLYPDQENVDSLKRSVNKKFKSSFCGNDMECDQYLKFLNEWSLQIGTKEKLNKKWMKLTIALKVLSSRIKPLSFNHNFEDSKTIRRNILREAIAAFDITIFGNDSYDEVKKLWDDAKCELKNLKIINNLRTNYQLACNYISDIDEVDSLSLSILLWLMGKCPLILTQDIDLQKVLELCIGERFILLEGDSCTKNLSVFKTLSDLKIKTFHYNQLIQNFTCSLQGKEEISLYNLIRINKDMLTVLKTDDLLEMCDGHCNIGDVKENLSEPYIERSLLKNVIDFKLLDNVTKGTVVILDCASEKKNLDRLRRYNLINIDDDYLNAEKSHTESSSLNTNIYLSKEQCEYSRFNTVCNKTQNAKIFHQFRVRNDGNLEWIRSKGDVSDIEKYKLSEYYPVEERDLSSSEFKNKINLLVSDPGMGKSELMKSFKNRCFSDCFTVIIDPKDVYSVLKNAHQTSNYVETFENFLLDVKYKMLSDRDKAIFRIFLKKNKVIYVWDAFDELSDQHRDIVANIIAQLSKNCLQWVTSRCHLQDMLERKFNVLSLNLNKFDEEEQTNYIRERFANLCVGEEIKIIIEKIESSFVLVEHKDILGIPLQLYMLTELFRQDREKYLALFSNTFLLTDLYNYFIQEKINIFYRDKLALDLNTAYAEELVQSHKDKVRASYTNAALRLLLPEKILTELAIENKILSNHTNLGIVTEVADQIPRFLHNSFAEYLAAFYFVTEFKHREILIQIMFDPKYINVRFFFDLLLAGDSKAHVAILYRNFNFLSSCDSKILTSIDFGGRSALHLVCSWGQRYPELNVKYLEDTYIVDDGGKFSTVLDKNEYLEALDCLLEKCDSFKSDEIYNMTPEEYARKNICLLAEMRILMKQNIGKPIERDHLINILYHSACYGYYHELEFFFELLGKVEQNFVEQRYSTKSKLSPSVVANMKNKTGMTLLSIAAIMGHIEVVKFLVKAGANINLASEDGFTPIMAASYNGHNKIVEFLVNAVAGVNLPDDDGCFTLLAAACATGYENVVEFLFKAGADVNPAGEYGFMPLTAAAFNGHDKITEFLVKSGADIDRADEDGNTLLNWASANGFYKIVKFLIKAGANINRANRSGTTPLNSASLNGHYEVVEFLVEEGADINLANNDGFTALNLAAYNGYYEIVKFLVEAGADIDLPNYYGSTHSM